jgi:hypothetical protein
MPRRRRKPLLDSSSLFLLIGARAVGNAGSERRGMLTQQARVQLAIENASSLGGAQQRQRFIHLTLLPEGALGY